MTTGFRFTLGDAEDNFVVIISEHWQDQMAEARFTRRVSQEERPH